MNKQQLAKRIYEYITEFKGKDKKYYCINEIKRLIDWSRIRNTQFKLNHIYVVTTLRFGYKYINPNRSGDGKYHSFEKRTSPKQRRYFTIIKHRTWGWFKNLGQARTAIENNWGDIYEGEYNYAVIEKVTDGILHSGELSLEYWYKWHGSWRKGKYKRWKKPKRYDNIIGFMTRMQGLNVSWKDALDETE